MNTFKPTVVFDLDGVIHSYSSGWQGETAILDPIVPGIDEAIAEIREAGYCVAVVSTRCASPEGLKAVTQYLADNSIKVDIICKEKPPAIVYIDDRAICFDGDASSLLDNIKNFKPWYQKPVEEDLGEWTRIDYDVGHDYACSKCGFLAPEEYKHCPECAKRMMR